MNYFFTYQINTDKGPFQSSRLKSLRMEGKCYSQKPCKLLVPLGELQTWVLILTHTLA